MQKLSLLLLSVVLVACSGANNQKIAADEAIASTPNNSVASTATVKPTAVEKSQLVLLPSAKKYPSKRKHNLKENNMQDPQIWHTATVSYISIEGGFYGLITEKGAKLLPMNLDKQYRLNGSRVRVKGKTIPDMMTIQQWGTPFRITEITLLEKGKSPSGDLW